jgi:hypothetical protein
MLLRSQECTRPKLRRRLLRVNEVTYITPKSSVD